MLAPVDTAAFPRVARYLAGLPNGWLSHPECECKATLYREALAALPRRLDTTGLDPLVVSYVEEPPPMTSWVPEVVSSAVYLAIADRVFQNDDAFLVCAAEHVPSGTLAAFTVLVHPRGREDFAIQEDTLVLREHRGRRLGMHVKVVNLEALRDARPEARRVHTGNAEENTHMLAINVALGFRPAGTWASWQKRRTGAGRDVPVDRAVDEERDA